MTTDFGVPFSDIPYNVVEDFLVTSKTWTSLGFKNYIRGFNVDVTQDQVSQWLKDNAEKHGFSIVPGPYNTYKAQGDLFTLSLYGKQKKIFAPTLAYAKVIFCKEFPGMELAVLEINWTPGDKLNSVV